MYICKIATTEGEDGDDKDGGKSAATTEWPDHVWSRCPLSAVICGLYCEEGALTLSMTLRIGTPLTRVRAAK